MTLDVTLNKKFDFTTKTKNACRTTYTYTT